MDKPQHFLYLDKNRIWETKGLRREHEQEHVLGMHYSYPQKMVVMDDRANCVVCIMHYKN